MCERCQADGCTECTAAPAPAKKPWSPPTVEPFTPDVLGVVERLRELRCLTARLHARLHDPSTAAIGFSELTATVEQIDKELEQAMDRLAGGRK